MLLAACEVLLGVNQVWRGGSCGWLHSLDSKTYGLDHHPNTLQKAPDVPFKHSVSLEQQQNAFIEIYNINILFRVALLMITFMNKIFKQEIHGRISSYSLTLLQPGGRF